MSTNDDDDNCDCGHSWKEHVRQPHGVDCTHAGCRCRGVDEDEVPNIDTFEIIGADEDFVITRTVFTHLKLGNPGGELIVHTPREEWEAYRQSLLREERSKN